MCRSHCSTHTNVNQQHQCEENLCLCYGQTAFSFYRNELFPLRTQTETTNPRLFSHAHTHRHHWARLMTSLMWSQNPLPNFQCCYPFILLARMIWAKLNLVSQWAPGEAEWDFSSWTPSNSVALSQLIWGKACCIGDFWQDSMEFLFFTFLFDPFCLYGHLFLKSFQLCDPWLVFSSKSVQVRKHAKCCHK